MSAISKALMVLLLAATATWLPAQAKATTERTQAPKVQAPQSKDQAKREAITVSVTPFLKSADPHPLPSIPKKKARNQKTKAGASR